MLSATDRTRIKAISSGDVEATVASLATFIRKSRWIAKSNRYCKKTTDRIADDFGARPGALQRPRHLSQYIAASSLLHCADGWSYLGRSISSLLRGDPHRARHLAYYAELRAAMSLLASEGIGIFKNKHFAIDGSGSVTKIGSGSQTHVFAWECLEYWSTLSRSGRLFATVVTPHRRSLSDWLTPIGGTSVISPQARRWFQQWGMDLKAPKKDREARNESSYRPDGIPNFWQLTAEESLVFSSEFWEAFGITGDSLFSTIDSHILRRTVESAFRGILGLEAAKATPQFEQFVAKLVDDQNFDVAIAANWKRFLLRQSTPADPRIFEYSALPPTDPNSGHAVPARAALLLRVAAGAVLRLMMTAGISGDNLEFWWGQLGTTRGLWNGTKTRAELADLWADISPLVESVQDFRTTVPLAERTFHRVGRDLSDAIMQLGGCERFAIWSMTA